jgi:hypothetical protein
MCSEVKLPKATIELTWVTFLAFHFWCTLTTLKEIQVMYLGELDIFNQPCEPRGLRMGKVSAVLGLHIDLDQLKNEATP